MAVRRRKISATPKHAPDQGHNGTGGSAPSGRKVTLNLNVSLKASRALRGQTGLFLFDEAEQPLCHCQAAGDSVKVEVPASINGRMVTVVAAPIVEGRKPPTLDQLRRRGAPIVRVPVDSLRRPIDAGVIVLDPRLFERSCCRVRGRVVRRIQLPNGTTITRPLCNARVVIHEVDVSLRSIITRLADDLVLRLSAEIAELNVPPRPGPIPDPPPLLAAHAAHNAAPMHARHAGHVAHTEVIKGLHLQGVEATRAALLGQLDLIKVNWCRWAWLHHRYDVDRVKAVELDAHGGFDTDISYYCYGDRPDLYFTVEQGCGDDWRVVHAPSVACHTHWDYCCGDEVEIVVTSTDVGLGPTLEACPGPYAAADPASIGSWQMLPYSSEVFVVHAALMRTGKVLMFSGGVEDQLPKESRVWDPVSNGLAAHTFTDDLFCAYEVAMPDGRVLVMGGSNYNGPHGRGIKVTYSFDPGAPGWVKHADMAFGRWYPTAVVLPDGRVIVLSGRSDTGPVVAEIERFNPATNTWTTLPASANKTLDIYPSLHLMSNGRVFYTGTRWEGGSSWPRPWSPPDTALFDPATSSWSDVGPHVIPNRTEGTSVLLPPRVSAGHHHGHGEEMPPPGTLSRVFVLGGDGGTLDEKASAEVIDLADPVPQWQRIADMHHRRVNPNAVILPDGTVLVCAGITGFKWDPDPGRALESELFDPQTLTWRRAAVMTEGRQYHSVSLLLPDGRVLNTGSVGGAGGGTNLTTMEVFSPPYLFRGPRPKITSYPATAAYGGAFTVSSLDTCRIRRLVFVRPGAPTHHTDTEQRLVPLDFTREGACDLRVHVPDDRAVLPPGYYMLFAVDDCDIPSEGKFIRVG